MQGKPIDHIGELTPDPANARRHTPRNVGLITDALQEVGAARSIVIDESGTILCGNATVEAAAEAGIQRVQVIDADGQTLVAVRRTGLTPQQKTRLALYDNRTAELAEWDTAALQNLEAEQVDLSGLWTQSELEELLAGLPGADGDVDLPEEEELAKEPQPVIGYTLIFDDLDQQARFHAFLRFLKSRYQSSDTIAARLDAYLRETVEELG